ncbi:MAG: MBL fold metallo-hydrolase [Clostridia bacterium]|nr:MBL fold metallo-hydrolase [Clostridia bacterium]
MTSAEKKKIATWIIVPLMAFIFLFDIASVVLGNILTSRVPISPEPFDGSQTDRIHFLNTANSDAILLESDGHFALVDSGEGSFNPRRKGNYTGFEDVVIDYLKKVAAGDDGKVRLDFILGTHNHYDHIGCFHAILSDSDILVEKAYFKRYEPAVDKKIDKRWGLDDVYTRILDDLRARDIPLVQDLPAEPFAFGNFTVQFYNTVTPKELYGSGENAASVGVKVTKGEKSAFLAADITRTTGLSRLLEDEIGHVDVLKLGHHGYYGSGSFSWFRKLSPEIAVVTNRLGKIYPNEKWMLIFYARLPLFATVENDGVIVSFGDDGSLTLTNHIHGGIS